MFLSIQFESAFQQTLSLEYSCAISFVDFRTKCIKNMMQKIQAFATCFFLMKLFPGDSSSMPKILTCKCKGHALSNIRSVI